MVGDIDVPSLWLRDACMCGECRDEFSGQRLRGVLALDPDTCIASWRDDGDDIERDVLARRSCVALLEVLARRQRPGQRGGLRRSQRAAPSAVGSRRS